MPKSRSHTEESLLRRKRSKLLNTADQDRLDFDASLPGKPQHAKDKAFNDGYKKLAGAPGAYTEMPHGRIKNTRKKKP